MGMPAARLTDLHVCAMVTGVVPHVGGAIAGPCAPTVIIGGLPAARITDLAVCVGPPDLIAKGSASVLISGLPAARQGDNTVHGGVIVSGMPTVLIGDAGSGSGGGGAGGGGMGPTAQAAAQFTGSAESIKFSLVALMANNLANANSTAQIQAYVDAAKEGKPFCKICHDAAVAKAKAAEAEQPPLAQSS